MTTALAGNLPLVTVIYIENLKGYWVRHEPYKPYNGGLILLLFVSWAVQK